MSNHPKTKEEVQIEQQVLYNLAQIIETFPQYSLARHFLHFLRKKGDSEDPYFWSDKKLLKKVEDYYDELKNNLLVPTEEDEDY